MAKNNKKKTTKNNKKKASTKKKELPSISLNSEAISIIFICLSFLLFFSIYRNNDFILLTLIKSFCSYLFGYFSYILPFVTLSMGSYIFIKKENLPKKKYIFIIASVLIFCAILEISDSKSQFSITESIVNAGSKNGGLFGYIFGAPCKKLVGTLVSYIILSIALIFSIINIFGSSLDSVFNSFKSFFVFVRDKIIDSLSFDDKEDEDNYYEEKDIIIKDDINKMNITDDVVVSSKEALEDLKDIDFSVSYGINRKREKKVQENNNKEGLSNSKKPTQKPAQKPNIQLNMRNLNPFAKKPKVRVMDFSELDSSYNQKPHKNLESIRRENNSRHDDNYLVNLRKNQSEQSAKQNVDVTTPYIENYIEDNYSHDTFIDEPKINDSYSQPQYEEPTVVVKVAEIEKYEKTIKALKDEMDRQIFLFQDTQKEFLEQKKMEQSLLKIINAQRETIEKQTNELEVYKNISRNNSININEVTSESDEVDEFLFNEAETTNPLLVDDDALNISLSNIKADAYKIASELTDDQIVKSEPYDNDYIDNFFETSNIDDTLMQELYEEPVAEIFKEHTEATTYTFEDDEDSTDEIDDIIEDELVVEPYTPLKTADDAIKAYEPSIPMPSYNYNKNERYAEPEKPNLENYSALPVEEKHIYKFPTVDFLNEKPVIPKEQHSKTELISNSKKLEATLKSFGVVAKVLEVSKGPSVTRYEIQPGLGVKVSKIANLADDLALNLAAKSIRIQAPIPGKAAVGIEVPNESTEPVFLREVLDDENFKNFKSKLAFGIGKDITGKIVVADLATMPHLLIAGATGSGKSVCVNTLITSIVYKSSPEEVKLIMIDPKVVELSVYNGIPHLLLPVITDPKKASAALNWAVREMEKRYKLFSDKAVRDLKGYNAIMAKEDGPLEPQIVIIIDELADLMMTAAKEVEAAIIRLAQMARAAGIHLIIATQRPSVDVITGIIKANIPSRLAFSVSSGIDSKTILDETGAEKLLGKGDMLFKPMGAPEPMRIQGAFISDKEVESIVSFLKTDADHEQMMEIIEEITSSANPKSPAGTTSDKVDEIFEDVVDFIITQQKASTSLIQRRFRVGFNRAARIIDELEDFGVIGPDEGNKPRKVLLSKTEWDNKFKV